MGGGEADEAVRYTWPYSHGWGRDGRGGSRRGSEIHLVPWSWMGRDGRGEADKAVRYTWSRGHGWGGMGGGRQTRQ